MGMAKSPRSSVAVRWILYFACSIFCSASSGQEIYLNVGETSKLQLSPSLQVVKSPGAKPGTSVLCERVHIFGLPRLKNLKKYSNSLKVMLSHSGSGLRRSNVEACFHRNATLGIGMCPQGKWEKVDKGSWTRAMSPFDHKLLDVRVAGSSPESIEISIKEEFFLYRVIFLVVGIMLLSVASSLSKSLVFYYSSAMAIGIILVILVVLFQGMKLLPTGRKNSLAIFIYSSLVGLGTFLLRYLPGLLHSVLVEMGINEDMYYPLAIFLLAFVVLAGAWMGFWAVRKLVLTEDGSIDITTSLFVTWSIRVLAVVMILQSTLDPLLAAGALMSGILVSSILRRTFKRRYMRRLYKKSTKLLRNIQWESPDFPDLSPFSGSHDEYNLKKPEKSELLWPRPKRYSLVSCSSPMQGTTPSHELSDTDVYPSTVHGTPQKRKFLKEEWDKFTQESTQKAVKELVSSPDFTKWVATNAERITVSPNSTRTSRRPRHKWLFWS